MRPCPARQWTATAWGPALAGVLATVNSLLAEHGVNIEGQLLSTKGSLGYVVTDVSGSPTDDVVQALEALPETVRLRVLL